MYIDYLKDHQRVNSKFGGREAEGEELDKEDSFILELARRTCSNGVLVYLAPAISS